MSLNNERIDRRASNGLLAGVVLIALAIGIIVWQLGKYPWYSLLYTMVTVIGVYLAAASFVKDSKISFAPSESSYYLISGCLMATVGAIGLISLTTNHELWVYIVVIVAVVAVLAIYRNFSKKG
jgi:cyanate permease